MSDGLFCTGLIPDEILKAFSHVADDPLFHAFQCEANESGCHGHTWRCWWGLPHTANPPRNPGGGLLPTWSSIGRSKLEAQFWGIFMSRLPKSQAVAVEKVVSEHNLTEEGCRVVEKRSARRCKWSLTSRRT